MAETVRLIDPRRLNRNPENPRLIFHADELQALQDSIERQGILVPLTVYHDNRKYFILDGERRWRSAVKLGLTRVPVIVQPKPDRLQNIMMMFAIHNARKDWDPLPTAYKLRELEREFESREGRQPTESELAELSSLRRGEVRRLKKLLNLPEHYRQELMAELERPRSEQKITVDHVLEVTNAATSLRKRAIISATEEDQLRRALLDKFRSGAIVNTVAPRKLARMARAVEREEIAVSTAKRAVRRLISDPTYTIDQAFQATVEQVDFEHGLELLIDRIAARLEEHEEREYEVGESLRSAIRRLKRVLRRF
ncbi:MAG TPA: ParB/RepB/Spo0J family partition protein [Actinomycetota bacterium]|nr:ParB/RepB/Spo0J family partition protein [Actinomycetota bacterium]